MAAKRFAFASVLKGLSPGLSVGQKEREREREELTETCRAQ